MRKHTWLLGLGLLMGSHAAAQGPPIRIPGRVTSPKVNLGAAAPKNARLLGQARLTSNKIGLVRRPPITRFRPLVFQENGSPVDPNRKIRTPDGRELTVRQAQEGQDALERALNGEGYSLYTDEDESRSLLNLQPTSRLVSLRAQANRIKQLRAPRVIKPLGPGDLANLQKTAETMIKAAEEVKKQQKKEEWEEGRYKGAESVRREKSVGFEVGSADWFAVSAQGGLVVDVSAKERNARASADLNAVILGNSSSLIHGLVEATDTLMLRTQYSGVPPIRRPERYKLRAEVSILGVDLIAPINSIGKTAALQQTFSQGISFRYDVEIPIIPGISAVGSVGAQGTGGLVAAVNGTKDGMNFSVSPFVNSTIFAEAGVTVGFPIAKIEGGIGANLTLVDYRVDFISSLVPTVKDYNGMAHYAVSAPLQVSHSLKALNGNLYAFVRLGYWSPTFTNPFRIKHKTLFDTNLVSWEGINEQGVLASYDADAILLPVPVQGP